jgi:hypothetical protein
MNAQDRDFFGKIKKAAFANPFGEERERVDLELTGLGPQAANDEVLAALITKVEKKIKEMGKQRGHGLKTGKGDSQLVEFSLLFFLFHTYCDDFDRLIEEQVEAGNSSCRVTFASRALQAFSGFGFTRREALHYFALFFQMRRAYYFINGIAGKSPCVRILKESLWDNIFTKDISLYNEYLWERMEDFSTLLLGETGTGKGLAAAAIGRSGFIPFNEKTGCFNESFTQAFVSINLSQFPEQLIESELFGHRKGAFTGAVDSHSGVFSRCSPCGAIFLDEIGDVSIPVQIKLLQVLQERTFTPVGSHKPERFVGRVIAATNKDISELRQKGEFRNDFYYRLCSDIIEVPPLKKRLAEDSSEMGIILSLIVRRILRRDSEGVVKKIRDYLQKHQPKGYSWPGNVRELEQCVRSFLLKNKYIWHQEKPSADKFDHSPAGSGGSLTAQSILSDYCKALYGRLGSYEAVAKVTRLDRRTVKKHIDVQSE